MVPATVPANDEAPEVLPVAVVLTALLPIADAWVLLIEKLIVWLAFAPTWN